jgi:ribonuclease P protein component
MLPRHLRLTRPEDFRAAAREGKRWRGPLITLAARPNGLPHSRYGFAVGKRVDKRAVARNRVKRRLREATRLMLPQLADGFDVVISARPGAAEATYQALDAALRDLMQRADLYTGDEQAFIPPE